MSKAKLIGTGTAILLAGAVGFGPGALAASASPAPKAAVAAAQPAQTTLPVTGQVTNTATGATSAFAGQISDLSTRVVNGVLTLSGTITGTGLPAGGTDFTTTINQVTAPGAACDILNLDLGPLDLNLLGLRIQLNQVQLDITAVPGAGNLLGNLLCAVAGLLDNTGSPLGGISALLNRLLTGLGL
jgi:hypothetical protein